MPEIAVARIREDAPFETSCYVGCGVTTGVGAVINTAKVRPGENVVVFGLGGIGLNVIQGAKLAGADPIIGVDINPAREEWGRKFGMTHFIDARGKAGAEVIAEVQQLTDGLLTQATRIAGVPVELLALALVAGDGDLVGVDDDDEVAGIDVRGVDRLVLPAQELRGLAGQATEHDVGRVDDVPGAGDVGRLGAEGAHADASSFSVQVRCGARSS